MLLFYSKSRCLSLCSNEFSCIGEDVYVALYGVSTDVNVRLDKNALKLENTYITSASQRYVNVSMFP